MGVLDKPFRETLAPLLIDTFVDIPMIFKRTERVYNPLTGVTVPTSIERGVKMFPSKWTEEELREDPLRKTMLKATVAAKDADDAGINIRPGTESSVYGTRAGVKWRVLPVRIVSSGDQDALYIVGLQK